MAKKKQYWLFKSEPDAFSFDDLKKEPQQTAHWDGVRNYQARNMLRDEIGKNDGVLFYHSSCKEPAVMGTATVVKTGYPDHTQFEKKSKYYDAKSNPEEPRWFMVDVKADKTFSTPVTLKEMRDVDALSDMKLLRKGMRLSIQPVSKAEWDVILKMGRRK